MTRKPAMLPTRFNPTNWMLLSIGLFLLTITAYWNSFHVPFVFDDLATIQRNASVRFGDFNWNLLTGRAVLYLTFTLNYLVSGQSVVGYHVVNFIIHMLNGLMVLCMAHTIYSRLAFKSPYWMSFFSAAFFLVHPIQTESVTYISSRSELLSTMFYLAGMLVFVYWPVGDARMDNTGRGCWCAIVILPLFLLAISAKETAITLPAAILLYNWLFMANINWRFYLIYLSGGSIVGYHVLTANLYGSVGAGLPGHLSPWHYLLTQTRVIIRYLQLVVLPIGQNLDYDFQPSLKIDSAVILSTMAILAIISLSIRLYRSKPVITFAALWVFITLAPTSSFIPILDVIFEHRMYLPMAGIALAFPVVLESISGWLAGKKMAVRVSLPRTA